MADYNVNGDHDNIEVGPEPLTPVEVEQLSGMLGFLHDVTTQMRDGIEGRVEAGEVSREQADMGLAQLAYIHGLTHYFLDERFPSLTEAPDTEAFDAELEEFLKGLNS